MRKDKFNDIVDSVDRGASLDVDYKTIKIKSAKHDYGVYNFYESVTGENGTGWFGYRVVEDCIFGKYCGAANLMNIGGPISEFQLVESIVDENLKAGFGSVENLYQPASLLEYYGYHMPDAASLPPAYIKIPFQFRNDDDDDFCDNFSPPWALQYNYHPAPENDGWAKRTNISPQKSLHSSDDDDQSSGEVDSPLNGRVPGSNPLGDATLRIGNSRESSQADERPLKRRRGNIFVADTADDDEEDEEVCAIL